MCRAWWAAAGLEVALVRYEDMIEPTRFGVSLNMALGLLDELPVTQSRAAEIFAETAAEKLRQRFADQNGERYFRAATVGDGAKNMPGYCQAVIQEQLQTWMEALEYEEYG